MTQQPWLEPTDDDLTRRGEHPYQRADQVELRGEAAASTPAPVASGATPTARTHSDSGDTEANQQPFVLAIISLGVAIPLTAIAASNVTPGLLGILIVWIGIVAVNVAFALSRRR